MSDTYNNICNDCKNAMSSEEKINGLCNSCMDLKSNIDAAEQAEYENTFNMNHYKER